MTHTSALSRTAGADAPGVIRSRTILVVDDEDGVRLLLVRWLEASGYLVVAARGADEALARLNACAAAVVVCDIRMPGHDGLWLAGKVRERFPETAVVIASGVQDVEASLESIRHGVVDYLMKPFGRDRLRDAVQRALEWHEAAWDARRWREALELDMAGRRARLFESVSSLAVETDDGVEALFAAVSLSERDAYPHAVRVRDLAIATGVALGLDGEALACVGRAALLHDIGKLALPDAVLKKPAPLTAEEQALVRTFPEVGAGIIEHVPFLASAAPLVRDAHERVDGHGYPRGIPGAAIPQGARIIGITDAYDTMIHPRLFRDALSPAEAALEIQRCAGTQFDAAIAAVFLRSLR